jgi:LacI family transcriptional regulator
VVAHRVTIADVAREAGVSQQTVSRALNNKGEISAGTRQHVLEIVGRLDYRPSTLARGLATRHTTTIGLVVPDIANPFFSELARGAEDAAQAASHSIVFCNTVEDPERELSILRTLEDQRVDGVVLCSSRLPREGLLLAASRHPALVLVNRAAPGSGLRSVAVDDEAGAVAAVRHLVRSGRRAIGFLAGPPASSSGERRRLGYLAAMAEYALEPDPALAAPCAPTLEGGREAALALLRARPDVDGLFCYNDLAAVGALQACTALGLSVPGQVAVVGCDDILLAGLVTPALSTLRSDQRLLGRKAVEALLDGNNGCGDGADTIWIRPELVVRASAP